MTIHSEHPFLPSPEDRDVFRQLRGRLPAPVTIVATGRARARVGLTVSSLLLVAGEPNQIVLMVDPDSDLGEAATIGTPLAVSVLTTGDGLLADTFAGLAPSPGGPFTVGSWVQTDFGPVRDGVSWLGARVADRRPIGWSVQVTAVVEHVRLTDAPALLHQRGHYRT